MLIVHIGESMSLFKSVLLVVVTALTSLCGGWSVECFAKGTTSTGGSFGNENSLRILRWAAEDLARQIRNSSPEIYRDLPAGWTQDRLADMIANVSPMEDEQEFYNIPDIHAYGQRLMFWYTTNPDGSPYITATKLFMEAYSHFEVNTRPKQDFFYTIEEVKLKLAHEVAHHLGLGLTKKRDMPEARAFGRALLDSLDSDNFECLPMGPIPKELYTPQNSWVSTPPPGNGNKEKQEQYFATRTTAFVFNRPTGNAAEPTNTTQICVAPDGMNLISPEECDARGDREQSEAISVFAPRSYEETFGLRSVKESILRGKREYGNRAGYFSWKLIDRRQSVLTEEGYRSNYKYKNGDDMNNNYGSYHDYQVKRSSADQLVLESYAPLMQDNWVFYRSQGKSQIQISFRKGVITKAKLIILEDYRQWFSESNEPQNIHIEVPLKCVRSYKPLVIPQVEKD